MLAYLATKDQFLKDAPTIEDIVRREVKKKLGHNVGDSEYSSWRNSLGNAMYHALNTPDIPGDAGVAIEYRVNGQVTSAPDSPHKKSQSQSQLRHMRR